MMLLKYFILFMLFIRILIEFSAFLRSKKEYIEDYMNYTEGIMYSFTFFYVIDFDVQQLTKIVNGGLTLENVYALLFYSNDRFLMKNEFQHLMGSLAILMTWLKWGFAISLALAWSSFL